MTVPHPQLAALTDACIGGETQIRQQLGQHLLRVGVLLADEAAHTDVHTTGEWKGPGEALFH